MLRNQRLDDVSCAVCMEDLFHRRDDLDEIMPIATPDCGHVFHERCLLEWFRTQTLRYVAQAREQGLGTRIGRSPSPSDAPVECPTCRNECFADPETGEPSIHRLFIHFGDGGGHRSSSQIDSSPVQWRSTQGKEKEVMGLARRARGLTEEVKALSGESHEDDVVGMMRRVEALKNDVVSIKALTGIKTYLGGLNAAINTLRNTLETHPLITTLNDRIRDLQSQHTDLHQHNDHVMRTLLPREIKKAITQEQDRAERRIRKVQEECELIKRELEREQVAKRTGRRAMEESAREGERRIEELKTRLEREKADRESLASSLNDRTKLLKMYQSKAESRRNLKSQVEDLRAENTRLKAELEFIPSQSHKAAVPPGPRSTFSDLFEDIGTKDENTTTDLSIQEIAAESFAPSQAKVRRSAQTKYALDESLHVDMTHGDRKRARSASRADISPFPLPPLQKPTARTYSFQLAEPSEKRGSLQTTFFDNEEDENDENVIMPNSSPSPAKRGRTNPFMIDREASEKRKMLRAASPIAFTSTSGVSAQPHFHASNKAGGSIVDWLGISDTSGRPKKGVAVGAKVKRRV